MSNVKHHTGRVELGADIRRPDILNASQFAVAASIDQVVPVAYDLLSAASHKPVAEIRQMPGSCKEVSFIMQALMVRRGLDTRLMEYRSGAGCHYFLETLTGNPYEELFGDATWKQMVRRWSDTPDYDQHPDALIIPSFRPEIGLSAHGIPDESQRYWTEAGRSGRKWNEFPSVALEVAMAAIDNGP